MTQENKLEVVETKVDLKTKTIDPPKEYFTNRKGLYVFSDFKERILPKAQETKEDTKYILASYKLLKSADDKEIESELPEKHIFSESEVCAVISTLIDQQTKGEEGLLLNNGDWNLFYTPDFVVGVYWFGFGGEWGVYAWNRDGVGWGGGGQVFSPATGL